MTSYFDLTKILEFIMRNKKFIELESYELKLIDYFIENPNRLPYYRSCSNLEIYELLFKRGRIQ